MNQGRDGNQTVTQQNIPDWAMDYAQNTLDMARYYTNNQNYRPSTLDRDYSGIRGYNAQGRPNSQVGQSGLNPMPAQPAPDPGAGIFGGGPGSSPGVGAGIFGGGPGSSPGVGAGIFGGGPGSSPGVGAGIFGGVSGRALQNMGPDSFRSRGGGRVARVDQSESAGTEGMTEYEAEGGYTGPGLDLDGDGKGYYYDGPGANESNNGGGSDTQTQTQANIQTQGMSQEEVQALIDEQLQQFDANTITPDEMPTPFQAYDRQRFAAPSDRTVQGENLLANRVNEPNPFAEAQAAARGVSNYRSQFTPAALNLTGPTANSYNNVLSGLGNVNANLRSAQYGNANQGLQGPVNYQQQRSLRDSMQQFQDPYTDRVVNQTIQDLDRARRITNNDISGNAARVGAFGGSREALMRTENNRNFADRTAAAVGQLRSQGFQRAADLAQQENLQRLGLSASDMQNVRGLQSQGNLQGQNLTARDLQDVRGLQSQGALAAQGLDAQGALTAQGLGAQSDRDAMNYQQQLQRQGNQLAVEQARLAEQFRQGAGALNLQGAGALGNLAQMQTADERQRIADLLASGGAQDARNQQDLDFIYSEFNRELDYPGRQIDLRNAAISPATGSIVTTSQPRYQQSPLAGPIGTGLTAYGVTKNPYIALALAGYDLLS